MKCLILKYDSNSQSDNVTYLVTREEELTTVIVLVVSLVLC